MAPRTRAQRREYHAKHRRLQKYRERYANASSRYLSAATASQRARKAGWPPL
jgi:hypothetical protein